MLKHFKLYFSVFCFAFFLSSPFLLKGQNLTQEISFDVFTLKSQPVLSIFDTLIAREKKCFPDIDWYWSITFTKVKRNYKFSITRQSSICQKGIIGICIYKDEIILVEGSLPKDIFFINEGKKSFNCPIKTGIPDVEDYSIWNFLYMNGNIKSIKSYIGECL